jgi:hypothetical protein
MTTENQYGILWYTISFLYKTGHWWRFPGHKPIEQLSTSSCNGQGETSMGGYQVIIWKVIVGNEFEEYYTPCTLKTYFVDFKEEYCNSYMCTCNNLEKFEENLSRQNRVGAQYVSTEQTDRRTRVNHNTCLLQTGV